jgi:cyanate permease
LIPIPLILAFYYKLNWIFALALSLIYVIIANGVKAMVLSVMAYKMRKVMDVGAYSAISNAVASVSAGVTPTIIGLIIDNHGWSSSYLATLALTIIVAIAILVIDLMVRKQYRKAHKMSANEKLD